MNPFIAHYLDKPYIENNSDFDFYLPKLCVEWVWSTIAWATDCRTIAFLPASWRYQFTNYPIFKWLNNFSTWMSYWDNEIKTYLKDSSGVRSYISWILKVRVAKPTVSTIWGWTAYLKDTSSIWNINDVADNDPENKNFVWVGISTWDLSSYSNEITDVDSVSDVDWEWDNMLDNFNQVSDTSWTSFWETTLLSDFENYNWISNVFILRNKSFVINADIFAGLNGSRTYVIENWDLVINSNINFSDNIAFVVKWWDIRIDKTVTNIDWTYITILKDSRGWNFIWKWGNTINVLHVNGSLYWNLDDLISTRTYVKENIFNQIDVWTIVSFGSSLFRRPAPLISTFINEYIISEKVAK